MIRRRAVPTLLAATAAGAALAGYAAGYERQAFVLRRYRVPLLPPGEPPLRILHLSDLHATPDQARKLDWLRGLADLAPDLVVSTGDHLAHPEAVPVVLDALGGLLDRPGAFVLGSNDYFAPTFKNPARYLLPRRRPDEKAPELPWPDLVKGLTAEGWQDLTNVRTTLEIAGRRVELAGVDDPHLRRDRYASIQGPVAGDAVVAVGVSHAPYLRVLDAMAGDGFGLLLAGHTHGGQLRLPGFGALVTNCDLDRGRARGLSRHPAGDAAGAWLHVCAGLGTSPYAPVRFGCRPEAALLTVVPIVR